MFLNTSQLETKSPVILKSSSIYILISFKNISHIAIVFKSKKLYSYISNKESQFDTSNKYSIQYHNTVQNIRYQFHGPIR